MWYKPLANVVKTTGKCGKNHWQMWYKPLTNVVQNTGRRKKGLLKSQINGYTHLEKAQHTLDATLGSDRSPSTKLFKSDTIHCSLMTTCRKEMDNTEDDDGTKTKIESLIRSQNIIVSYIWRIEHLNYLGHDLTQAANSPGSRVADNHGIILQQIDEKRHRLGAQRGQCVGVGSLQDRAWPEDRMGGDKTHAEQSLDGFGTTEWKGRGWVRSSSVYEATVTTTASTKFLPNAMAAASRSFQSVLTMLDWTKGRTWPMTSFSQQVAISIKQTPAALHGFQSSSSSNSSCCKQGGES